MAQNVTLLGASYPDVPQVVLPKTGGGSAVFTDVSDTTASASDVSSSKYFYDANGEKKQGSMSTQSGATITPTRSQQTVVPANTFCSGAIIVDAIPNTYMTESEALERMFPVGSIYISTLSTAPTFGGTWVETKLPLSWDDAENGTRSYTDGAGTGTVHFWRRTA